MVLVGASDAHRRCLVGVAEFAQVALAGLGTERVMMGRSLGRCAAATMALAIAGPTRAQSTGPYVGKWSTKLAECNESESSFLVAAAAITLPTLSCEKVTFTKDGAAWRARASNCSG